MKILFYSLFLVIILANCNFEGNDTQRVSHALEEKIPLQQIPVYESFSNLTPVFQKENDTIYVVNFWATTCPPCIKEMPHFEELEENFSHEKIKVLLVSLDRTKDLETRVRPFIEKHKIKPAVVLLADQNYSAWTAKVDPSWYGALPATLILKNGERKFSFGAFDTFNDLKQVVEPFITK